MEIIILIYGVLSFCLAVGILWRKKKRVDPKYPWKYTDDEFNADLMKLAVKQGIYETKDGKLVGQENATLIWKPNMKVKFVDNPMKEVKHMMTFNEFDSLVAKKEGGKKEEIIGNIREARRIMFRLLKDMEEKEEGSALRFIKRQK